MGWFTRKNEAKVPWIHLESKEQLHDAIQSSSEKPVLFFKHSTRCGISSMALNRFENEWKAEEEDVQLFLIDLLNYREVSNEIEQVTGVTHQSPQVIVLKDGAVVYTATHGAIDSDNALNSIG